MKKTIIIIFSGIILILAFLFVLPVFFKKDILEAAKTTLNRQLNVQVEFADLKLSLISNFPKATIKLDKVLITGDKDFKSDTLLNISSVQATMNLWSVFKKSERSLGELILNRPQLHLIVNESGKTNWEMTKADEVNSAANLGTVADSGESGDAFELQLEKIVINDGSVYYDDKEAKMLLRFLGVNFDLSGNLYGTSTGLKANGKADDFLFRYDGVEYITKTSLETTTLLNLDYETMEFWIIENETKVNRLPLEIIGSVKMPTDSVEYNLQLKTKESDFDNFIALVPPVYDSYLKDIKTSGSATITGNLRGIYFEENYPAFSLNIKVNKGEMQFAGLPEKIENIKADIEISKPQGDISTTQVNIKSAHAEIKNNPVDVKLSLANLFDDLQFDGRLVGALNFNDVKDALPLDSVNISGRINANLFVKGTHSAIVNEQFEKIKSTGMVQLENFVYDSPDYNQKIAVPTGLLEFSPAFMILREFKMNVGQSDFSLKGRVSDYLNYILKDGTIKGDLQLNSTFVNLNELLRIQKAKTPANTTPVTENEQSGGNNPEEEQITLNIPKNLDLTFRTSIQKAVLDRVQITEINGQITAQNGKLMLDGLNMKMLEGEVNITGSYQNTPENQPLFDLGFDVIQFDIPAAFKTISGFQKAFPVAGKSTGKISTVFKMNGRLSPSHKIIASSLNGNGLFNTVGVQISESPVFKQLKGILIPEKLQNVTIDDFKANFVIANGNMELKPFKTKVAGQETAVYGSLSAQNLVDMRLDFKVNRDAFGTDIQNILSVLPGNNKITVVPASVVIQGPVGEPEVKMDLSEARKTITNATKDELQDSLNKLGKGLRKLLDK